MSAARRKQGVPSDAARSRDLADLGARLTNRPYARRGPPAASEVIRLVLIAGHAMYREALGALLSATPDISLVGEGDSGDAALALGARLSPDVMVLDLDLPGSDGSATLREMVRALPGIDVVVLTRHPEEERLIPLLEVGARGYLTKDAAVEDLIEAVRVVAGGEIFVRPSVARLLATAVFTKAPDDTPHRRFEDLSEREQAVLRQIAQGFSGAEVARRLGISTKTVAAYKTRIQEKLGLAHRTEYVRFAIQAGVLDARSGGLPEGGWGGDARRRGGGRP